MPAGMSAVLCSAPVATNPPIPSAVKTEPYPIVTPTIAFSSLSLADLKSDPNLSRLAPPGTAATLARTRSWHRSRGRHPRRPIQRLLKRLLNRLARRFWGHRREGDREH